MTGDHDLNVTVIGKLENGNDFSESDGYVFSKGVKPKAIGVTLAAPAFGSSGIQFGDW